jgi:hypothetical protein
VRSPVSIVFQVDANLDQASSDSNYVILVNKEDPPDGVIHRAQLQFGETVTFEVSWTKDGDFKIPFYACHSRLTSTEVHNELLVVKSLPEKECFTIALVTLRKPSTHRPDHVYIAAWPNPMGRTILTRSYVFQNETGDKINMLETSHERLAELADYFVEQVHGLDMFSINELASMANETGAMAPPPPLTRVKDVELPFWSRERSMSVLANKADRGAV